jgi:glutaredoxin-related protein
MICDAKVVITTFVKPVMKFKIPLIVLLLCQLGVFSQGLKVLISEEKKGKRITLFAENKTRDTLNVFLTVNAEGYRRSSLKPVIKDLSPGARVPMMTLIELEGTDSRYTFEMVVNDKESEVNFSYEEPERDIERVIGGQLVIFSAEDCPKCMELIAELTEKHIQHRMFDIKEDAVLYGQFMSFIERRLSRETKIRFPIIWNKDEVIFGYETLEETIQMLNR